MSMSTVREHVCQHFGCGGKLVPLASDPALPDHVELLECDMCDEVYEYDTETHELEVDA